MAGGSLTGAIIPKAGNKLRRWFKAQRTEPSFVNLMNTFRQPLGDLAIPQIEVGATDDGIARRAGRPVCRHAIRDFICRQKNPRLKPSRSCWKKMDSGSPPDISSNELTKQNHQKINEKSTHSNSMSSDSYVMLALVCWLCLWLWQESRCGAGEGCNFGGSMWLAVIDNGDYAQSWRNSSAFFAKARSQKKNGKAAI